jgi:hypothetical protein
VIPMPYMADCRSTTGSFLYRGSTLLIFPVFRRERSALNVGRACGERKMQAVEAGLINTA